MGLDWPPPGPYATHLVMNPTVWILPLVFHAAPADAPAGAYVDARTASVYAGACHFGGESAIGGREALLAWSIESGAFGGVDLAGARVAALVAGNANLAQASAARRSVVSVDAALTPERAAAAVAWLTSTRADLLGTVVAVRHVPLAVAIDADGYRVSGGELFDLSGEPMPDRACCAMPQNVWYGPFERVARPLVGWNARFLAREPLLERSWSRPDENAAFVGRFGAR